MRRYLKIGIVCYPSLGGSGVVATELGHALASAGHKIHFIAYEIPFRLRIDDHNIFFHQVEINRYDLFQYPDYALPLAVKIAEVAKRYCLDLVHVHYAIPHATSAFLAKQILGETAPKVITTLHGTDITLVGQDPAYFEIVKHSIEQSDRVTSVSESLKNETLTAFGISKPIEVIYNFFIPRGVCRARKEFREMFVSPEEKLLVHISNFRRVKRVEDVVRIFLKVRKEIAAKLILVGTGPEVELVRRQVKEAGVEQEVFFVGKNREVDRYVANADVLLLPSSQESFGLVALEAMAYGVPVVASRVGGIPEVIKEKETGFLYPVGDIDGMAAATLRLLKDRDLYRKLSEAGRKRAEEIFSVSQILPQYLRLYEEALFLRN